MINHNSHIEDKIVLLIDGELDKDQLFKVKEHLKDCPECKEIYMQYLSIKNETLSFYQAIDKSRIKPRQGTIIVYKFKYALVLLFLLFASIGIIFINTKRSEKVNTNNLIHEDQIDKQIINMEREIEFLKEQMSVEVL